jgi:hypothetical protein
VIEVKTDFKNAPRYDATSEEWDDLRAAKAAPSRISGEQHFIELHHLVPRSQGGDDVADNLIPLTRDEHRVITDYNPGFRALRAAIRHSLTKAEIAYVVGKKGKEWLDLNYPSVLNCGRSKPTTKSPVSANEKPRKRKRWVISIPDDAENGAVILDTLVEEARKKIGRPEGVPPYFPLAEALYIFIRDAESA